MERSELLLALEQVGPGGHALAVQLLGNQDDAADVLQDALVTALRAKSFGPTQGSLKAWFLTVVRNRCLDLLRQRKRRPQTRFDEVRALARADNDPDIVFERRERATLLRRELERLPADQREILVLREYLDLPYAEIARVLSIPAGTVMSRLHRARTALADRVRVPSSEREAT